MFRRVLVLYFVILGSNFLMSQGTSSYSFSAFGSSNSIGAQSSVLSGSVVNVNKYQMHSGFMKPLNFVKKHHPDFEINIFPNPTSDYISVVSNEQGDYIFNIVDMSGKVIKSKEMSGDKFNIDLKQIPPANYILEIIVGNIVVISRKIIKR